MGEASRLACSSPRRTSSGAGPGGLECGRLLPGSCRGPPPGAACSSSWPWPCCSRPSQNTFAGWGKKKKEENVIKKRRNVTFDLLLSESPALCKHPLGGLSLYFLIWACVWAHPPLSVTSSSGSRSPRAFGPGRGTWPSAWPPPLSQGWRSSPVRPVETTNSRVQDAEAHL